MNDPTPDLKSALRGTLEKSRKSGIEPEDFPPPPSDWTSHRITRITGLVIFLALIGLGIWKGQAIIGYIKAHPFGAGLTIFVIIVVIALIAVAYWKHRTQGDLGMRYWDTSRKKRPH